MLAAADGSCCAGAVSDAATDAVASADDAAESAWVLAAADGSCCSGTVSDDATDAVAACCTDAVAAVGATGFRRPSRTN